MPYFELNSRIPAVVLIRLKFTKNSVEVKYLQSMIFLQVNDKVTPEDLNLNMTFYPL